MSLIQKSHRSMYAKQYYEANKERLLTKMKQYYNENKTEISEQQKGYYNENKEQILNGVHKYQKTNKDKHKVYCRKIYYKKKYNLNQFDNDYISDLLEIKDNQNIKYNSFEFVITLKELYDLQI